MDEDNEKKFNAATELVKAIPIYQDLVQPAAQELGKGLKTVAQAVNLALAPVGVLVWGFEEIKEFVSTSVTEKLKNTPKEKIVIPPANLAGPLLESLRYSGSNETLRELYAALLASAMNSETAKKAHPSFVEIIKQMNSDEAKLMKAFEMNDAYPLITVRAEVNETGSGFDHTILINYLDEVVSLESPDMTAFHLDNLKRLGLVEINASYQLADNTLYERLEKCETTISAENSIEHELLLKSRIIRYGVKRSPMGKLFLDACVRAADI